MIELYPHQDKATESIYRYFQHSKGNPVLEAPTGSGKSVIQSAFCDLASATGNRIMCLTHVKELLEQNEKAMKRFSPRADTGIYSASIGRRDTENQIVFAGIQSVWSKPELFGHRDLIIIDEAHLVPPGSNTRYRKYIASALELNPATKVIGMTATPYRLDNGLLIHGDDRVFTDIITAKQNGMDVFSLIQKGFLAPLTTANVQTSIDVSGVRMRGGDFVESDLATAADQENITRGACEEIARIGRDRGSWLVFATSIEHAEHVSDCLNGMGFESKLITGKTKKKDREAIINAFKDRRLRCVVNVNVLTTGFDAPATDLVAFLRPTMSASLYVQMCGRGMRIAGGKENCLVLDFAGNIERHGPVDDVRIPTAPKAGSSESDEERDAPMKECDNCYALVSIAQKICQWCGFGFPEPEPRLSKFASSLSIMRGDKKTEALQIEDVTVSRHEKPGKPDSMRVDYLGAMSIRVASEWVCFEHGGFARIKAELWWKRNIPGVPVPDAVSDAIDLARQFLIDDFSHAELDVDERGKYTEIISSKWHAGGYVDVDGQAQMQG